ncbi:MAG: hypothetical protein NT062_38945 [Proteobacteria bacterium]|nr:hypothetical protein [Pseudomonadota bacterium]
MVEEIVPGLYRGHWSHNDDRDTYALEGIAKAASQGTTVIWEVVKPVGYDQLVAEHRYGVATKN